MKWLFVMDPFEALDVDGDTTLALMEAAERRGVETWCTTLVDLSLEHERAFAAARRAHVRLAERHCSTSGEVERLSLDSFQVAFLREDPPFDDDYLVATLMCEAARGRTFFVNDPRGLREANEKLFALRFPELVPPTVVTRDMKRMRAFVHEQGGVAVVKPVGGRGGEGVFVLREGDLNQNVILETATAFGGRPAVIQRYLPEVREGDKRVLLLDGKPLGAVLRVPRADDARANLHIGGQAAAAQLTERDDAICARISPMLQKWGLHFVGIDVIGGWLTEINVTSPTGLRQINALLGVALEEQIVDWVEQRAKENQV